MRPPAASAAAIEQLLKMLADDDSKVRWSAIWALGEARSAAFKAVEPLLAIFADEGASPMHRRAAVNALGKIGRTDARIVPTLKEALQDKDAKVREIAAERLKDLREPGT